MRFSLSSNVASTSLRQKDEPLCGDDVVAFASLLAVGGLHQHLRSRVRFILAAKHGVVFGDGVATPVDRCDSLRMHPRREQ